MLKRWGKLWYYVGIAGNVGFIILYMITLFPGNPVTGRGGNVDIIVMTCELAQVAYIAITAIILAKERTIKISQRRQDLDKYLHQHNLHYHLLGHYYNLIS